MSKRSRDRILSRLRSAADQALSPAAEASGLALEKLGRNEKIEKLKGFMEAVRTEVHVVEAQNWIKPLKDILKKREIKTLLYAPQTTIGDKIQKHWPDENENDGLPELVTYEGHIENFKDQLFQPSQLKDSTLCKRFQGIAFKKTKKIIYCNPFVRIAIQTICY